MKPFVPLRPRCRCRRVLRKVPNIKKFKKTTTATVMGRLQAKGLMSRTMAVHVRYNPWYIFGRPLQNHNVK